IDWDLTDEQKALFDFTRQLVHLRLTQPVLRRRKYFQGRSIRGGDVKDVAWLAPDGREMTDDAWNAHFVRSLGMLLPGTSIEETNERGEPITGDTLLILLNAHSGKVPFTLPETGDPSALTVTTEPAGTTGGAASPAVNPLSSPFGFGAEINPPYQWTRLLDTMT